MIREYKNSTQKNIRKANVKKNIPSTSQEKQKTPMKQQQNREKLYAVLLSICLLNSLRYFFAGYEIILLSTSYLGLFCCWPEMAALLLFQWISGYVGHITQMNHPLHPITTNLWVYPPTMEVACNYRRLNRQISTVVLPDNT